MELLDCKFKTKEIKQVIMKEIDIKKAPGCDLVSGKILQELFEKCYKILRMNWSNNLSKKLRNSYNAIKR
jgi:hypothetical protein